MACGADNKQAKMAVKDGAGAVDFASGATPVEFNSESLVVEGSLLRSEGIRGTRMRSVNQTRRGPYSIGGSVNFDVTPQSILTWGYRALGDNTSNVLTPTESLPGFAVLVDKVSNIFRYEDCKVSQLRIGAGGPGLVTGTADIVGRGFTDTGLTFPSLTLGDDSTWSPLVFSDLVLNLIAVARVCNSFELIINNAVEAITRNALTPDCSRSNDFTVTLNANLPSNATNYAALKEPDLSGIAADFALTSTLEAVGVDIDLPVCQKPRRDQNVADRREQKWDISLEAVRDNSNPNPITITVDTTE